MPLVPFDQLPNEARLWIFGVSTSIDADRETRVLQAVDAWLGQWSAHGAPLTCARDWRERRFLVIGVDERSAGASGCSIDALYRVLQQLEQQGDGSFLGGGRVFHRTPDGDVVCSDRPTFAVRTDVTDATGVFDTSLTTVGAYRTAFERPLVGSWQQTLRR